MTICIAALCDDRKTIVLAADTMVGMQFVEAELTTRKINWVHKDWRILLAGNDVAPAFEIIDSVKEAMAIRKDDAIPVNEVMDIVGDTYRKARLKKAESLYLSSRGWSLKRFVQDGAKTFPSGMFQGLDQQIQNFDLGVTPLVGDPILRRGADRLFSIPSRLIQRWTR